MKLYFPYGGLSRVLASREQPPTTTPLAKNVRLVDVDKNLSRGGTRPGVIKAYTNQVGGAFPVVKIVSVTTTFLESE
ncbi:MAG: hypothetical protein WC451_03160 [Patescibacteria group bacterium]|jgi:hypothetical protein